jgi:hypothetical protein
MFLIPQMLMTSFTPTDQIAWTTSAGTYANNNSTITNSWGYTENNVQQLTFAAATGSNYDLYVSVPTTGYVGQTLIIKCWVKLGTATNWNLSVNNGQIWNSAAGQTFTPSNSSYTQISLSFVCPSTVGFNVHVGSNLNTIYGQTAQTAGTSYVYGWQIFVKGKQSLLESNLTVNGNITANGTITASDVLYDGITSLTTKISNLAPYTGSSSFQAGSITSLTNITSPACQINGNATITGDILLGLPQAYVSTTLTGKANLSGAAFTGNVSVSGSYGAWAQASLWTATYGTGNQNLTWMALITSNNITHTTNTNSFQVSQAGTYAISCYIAITTIASGGLQMIGRYSSNGSTWSNVLATNGQGAYLANTTMSLNGIYTMAANSYFDIQLYNATGSNVTLFSTSPLSYFQM